MKRIQIFQGDISFEMIPRGIFINCDLSGIMGHIHALQVRSSNLLLEKRVNHFKHSNLRHGTCNQPRRGNFHVCFLFHCTAVWWFIIVSFTCTTWELMELGLSHRERERELFILLRHARINMFCDMMCTMVWLCTYRNILLLSSSTLYRPWTCVQTLEWPLLTGVYSKSGSNLWVQRSWTLRTGQAAR